jgi:hypothetical protein
MSKARQLAQKPSQPTGRKNLIINGAMQVNQRGEQTGHATGYTLDRWNVRTTGSARFTVDDSTDVPSGQGFGSSLHINVTTADTDPSTSEFGACRTILEGQDVQGIRKGSSNARELTLSFWIKSTVTGTYTVELYDSDNARQVSGSYTVDTSNTWEKKTITFPADATGSFDNDNEASLYIQFGLAMGSDYAGGTLSTTWTSANGPDRFAGQVNAFSSTSNNIYITGVQLEVGSTATEFEHRSFGEELLLCQRYFQKYINPPLRGVVANSTTTNRAGMILPVTMRSAPSVTMATTGTTEAARLHDGANTQVITSIRTSYLSKDVLELDLDGASTWSTQGRVSALYQSSSSASSFSLSAEL